MQGGNEGELSWVNFRILKEHNEGDRRCQMTLHVMISRQPLDSKNM